MQLSIHAASNNMEWRQTRNDRISYKDFLVGGVVGAILVAANIYFMSLSGLATYYILDPVGAMPDAIHLAHNLSGFLSVSLQNRVGLPLLLHALLLRIVGDGYYTYDLMLFWPTALLLSLASWIGRRYAGLTGTICLVVATAMLPPLSFMVIGAARATLEAVGVSNFIWPSPASEGLWYDWKVLLKVDLLAGALLAWAVALISVDVDDVKRGRFFAAGACLGLAILTKSFFLPLYFLGWGCAVFINAIRRGQNGDKYIWDSYWALLALVPAFGLWVVNGGAAAAFATIYGAAGSGWHGSAVWDKPQFGYWYLFYIMPTAIGLGAQVVLAYAGISLFVSRARWSSSAWAALPALVAAFMMGTIYTINPFGKSFSDVLPIFCLLWLALLIVGAESLHSLPHPSLRLMVPLWLLPFALIAAIGGWSAFTTRLPDAKSKQVAADRGALRELVATVLSYHPHTVLWPCQFGGIPYILTYEAARQAYREHIYAPVFGLMIWDKDKLLHDPDYQKAARNLVTSHDIVISVAGGPHLFPIMGLYQAHTCDFVDHLVTAPDSPFRLVKTIKVGPTSARWLYFPAGPHVMNINVYKNKAIK